MGNQFTRNPLKFCGRTQPNSVLALPATRSLSCNSIFGCRGSCRLIGSIVIWVRRWCPRVRVCERGVQVSGGRRGCRGGGRLLDPLPLGSRFVPLGPGAPGLPISFLAGDHEDTMINSARTVDYTAFTMCCSAVGLAPMTVYPDLEPFSGPLRRSPVMKHTSFCLKMSFDKLPIWLGT